MQAISAYSFRSAGLFGWNTSTPDVCTWGGVTCSAAAPVSAATTGNTSDLVLELELLFLDLSGTLPPELGRALQLRALELGGNKFSGSVPPAWSALTRLTMLHLPDNRLTGVLPEGGYASQGREAHIF